MNFKNFKLIRILVSNTSLPSKKIGSWTNRISRFIESDENFFTYIFSPALSDNPRRIFCSKRKWIPFFPSKLRPWQILNFRLASYIKAFKAIPKKGEKIQIIIMDDLLLLEAFALLKSKGEKFDLVFSFHGHTLTLVEDWSVYVDKILFLTNSGYLETLQKHHQFTPIVSIVGNGVDGTEFFPLSQTDKEIRKLEFGLSQNSKILIWLSNNRPKKGFHLFKIVAKNIIDKYPDLVIWIIGINQDTELVHDRVKFFGKIPNDQLPKYLQTGDIYMFTSLWKEGFGLTLVEAAKCGNQVIASRMGGIPEVVSGINGVHLIDNPNRPEFWEEAFSIAWENSEQFLPDTKVLKEFHDLNAWMLNFKNALTS